MAETDAALSRAERGPQLERWFSHHGVPHFDGKTGQMPRLQVLFCLITIVALEAGIVSSRNLSASMLVLVLIALPVVFVLLTRLFCVDGSPHPWVVPAVLLLPAVVLYSQRHGEVTLLHPDPWIDFAMLLAALIGCVAAAGIGVPVGSGAQRALFAGLIAANLWLIVDGSTLRPADRIVDDALDSAGIALTPIPASLPALVVVLAFLAAILHGPTGAVEDTGYGARMIAPLILLLGFEDTYVADVAGGRGEVALALLALVAAFAVGPQVARSLSRSVRGEVQLRHPREQEQESPRGLLPVVLVALLAYPILLALTTLGSAGRDGGDALAAFAGTLTANAVLLVIGWAMFAFGIHHVVVWAIPEVRRHAREVLVGIVRGLPLLLVFATVLILTAEVWEVVVEMKTTSLVILVAVLLGLALVVVVRMTLVEVCEAQDPGDWGGVKDAAVTNYVGDRRDEFRVLIDTAVADAVRYPYRFRPLSRGERFNAYVVALVYQAAVFVPTLIASVLAFYVVGRLAVPGPVAGEWVFGDGTPASVGREFAHQPFLDQPWTRVSLLLGALSTLYLVVELFSARKDDESADFFAFLREAMRTRFAVRMAYYTVYAPEAEGSDRGGAAQAPEEAGPAEQGDGLAGRRPVDEPAPQREAEGIPDLAEIVPGPRPAQGDGQHEPGE